MILSVVSASDALALCLLGAMLLTLLAIGSLVLVMVKNVSKREEQDIELEKLLNDISEDEDKAAAANPMITGEERNDAPSNEWEKEPDWWKN